MDNLSIVAKNHSYWMAEREAEFQRVVDAKFTEIMTALLFNFLASGLTAMFVPEIDWFFYLSLVTTGIFCLVGQIPISIYLERFDKRFQALASD